MPAPAQFIAFDGVELSEYFSTWQERQDSRINTAAVPKRHGLYINDTVVEDARNVFVTGTIKSPDGTQLGLRTLIDFLSELFTHRNTRLQLWEDRYINAYKAQWDYKFTNGSGMREIAFTLGFLCPDPFWYGTVADIDSHDLTQSDTPLDITNNIYRRSISITNLGTSFVYPKITVTPGLTPLTTIVVRNLTNGRMFHYSGTVTPGTSLVIQTGDFLVLNNGVDDLDKFDGDFMHLNTGVNAMQIEGTAPADYSFEYTRRYL